MNNALNRTGGQASEGTERIEMAVRGMTCSGCAGRVQRALAQSPGAAEASVDLASGTASVTYDPATTNAEALVAAVRQVGYQAQVKADSGEEGGEHESD